MNVFPPYIPRYITDAVTGEQYEAPAYRKEESPFWEDAYDAFCEERLLRAEAERESAPSG